MNLSVYNVLNRKKELFKPLNPPHVNMYACGITVSGNAHIGHAYQAIIFDVIRKYLGYIGYYVNYVRNYTDVDDKIIIKARELNINPLDYANNLIIKTNHELELIGVDMPTTQARATECISDMIKFIEKLIAKNHAYVTETGDVFFSVNSFKNYGNFSNRIVEESISGVRKEVEPGKKDDKDFALWKSAKDDEIFWSSPWGNGRPGWHIECSTMSMKYLGETLDIHGGGKDLVFPHHENEIAQSESLTNKRFANFWIHNGLIKVNGQKMSKSLGNSILLEDLIKEYNFEVIRMTLLQNNYRSDLNIIDGMFEINEQKVYELYNSFLNVDKTVLNETNAIDDSEIKKIEDEFINAMNNDFNTSLAIANLFGYVNNLNKSNDHVYLYSVKSKIIELYRVLGLANQDSNQVISEIKNKYLLKYNITEAEIEKQILLRKQAKENKNYEEADQIRNRLIERGIILMDLRDGTKWDINFKEKFDIENKK